jgi:outer membrane protein TolC
VPISDYFLRINQAYSAATSSHDAARYDAMGARTKSGADGKVAYYTWLRARGGLVVATQALGDQKTHLTDAKNLFTVGRVSKADVLRAETAVAAAELATERGKNLVDITERQIRVAMHVPDEQPIVAGESLAGAIPPFQGNLSQLTQEAMSVRTEIKSIDANAKALNKNAEATRNGAFPQFAGVANTSLVNPNQRAFPQKDEFFPTWDLSLQLQWSPNDILTARGQASALYAQSAQVEAQRQVVRDGITLEVAQAYNSVKEAEFAIETSKRELAAAQEAYRVAHELFINGAATSTTLTDAETELTRARLDALNAAVDIRVSRVRLEHALGRDVKASP